MQCNLQYFTNNSQIGVRQAYMPVNGNVDDGYSFESFLPFVILARASQSGTTPNGSPGSATILLNSNSDQAAFPNQTLVQSMMQANRSDDSENASGFMTYAPNASNGRDFSGYYKQNMQEENFPKNFGAFLMPAFLIEGFWDDMSIYETLAATYDNLITNRLCEMANRIYTETDLRLWYPPGIYMMIGTNAPGPNTDAYFTNFNASFGGLAENDEKGLIILQIKSIE